jgi:hypothetical protein
MHNIYRIDEYGYWGNYTKVVFPDGQVMDENTHDFERDGFFWSDEPPQDYLIYLTLQNENTGNNL